MTDFLMGLKVTATADIEYGPLRLRIAEWAEVDPADVTMAHVDQYTMICAEEGRNP